MDELQKAVLVSDGKAIGGNGGGSVSDAKKVKYHDSNVEAELDNINQNLPKLFIVDGQLVASGTSATLAYPSGLNKDNCTIIGCQAQASDGRWFNYQYGSDIGVTASLQTNGIDVTARNSSLANKPVRITLYKIPN